MKRRRFIGATSGVVLGASLSSTSSSAMSVEFKISNQNYFYPENWTQPKIILDFDYFVVLTKNIDTNTDDLKIITKSGFKKDSLNIVNTQNKTLKKSDGRHTLELDRFDIAKKINIEGENYSADNSFSIYTKLILEINDIRIETEIKEINITVIESSRTVIDNFEDGSMSEYIIESKSKGSNVNKNRVYNGTYSFEHMTDGVGKYMYISNSGLNSYPKAGDTYQFRFYATNNSDVMRFDFGYQDTNNRYIIQYRNDSYGFYFAEQVNGSSNKLNSVSNPDYPTNEWLKMVIEWGLDGIITLTCYSQSGKELSQIHVESKSFTSGGIGMGHDNHNRNSTSMYFDQLEIL